MTERLQEGLLVGHVLDENMARTRIAKIELAKVNYDGDTLKLKFPSKNYASDLDRETNPREQLGIQYIFSTLSPILEP